jgi:hypothetical protein
MVFHMPSGGSRPGSHSPDGQGVGVWLALGVGVYVGLGVNVLVGLGV